MRAPRLLVALALAACGAEVGQEPAPQQVVLARAGSPHRPATLRPAREATMRKLGVRTRNAIAADTPFRLDVPDAAARLGFSLACVASAERAGCPPFRIEGRHDGSWQPLFEGDAGEGWTDHQVALPADTQERGL